MVIFIFHLKGIKCSQKNTTLKGGIVVKAAVGTVPMDMTKNQFKKLIKLLRHNI